MAIKTSVLEVQDLKKHYGDVKAVDGISFEISQGEAFGFLGPNGAGKTTTIRTFMGLLHSTAGEIKFFGKKVDPLKDVSVRKRIGYLSGELGLYTELNAKDNINHFGSLSKNTLDWTRINNLAERLELPMDRRVGELSKGNKQKVGIIIAMMGNFDLLCMDEPTGGLDPLMQARFNEILAEYQEETNCAIFLSSHILSEVEKVCDRVAIINAGKIIETSSIQELKMKHLKQFKLEFATEKAKKAFFNHLQSKYYGAVITSDLPTDLTFDLPPEHKFEILNEFSKKWGK